MREQVGTLFAAIIASRFIGHGSRGIHMAAADAPTPPGKEVVPKLLANFGPFSALALSGDGKWLVASDTRTVTL